ncbi:MAG TPA: hypothetical protein VM030_07655 [Acidimicrobiales bacterium]|nr:hypothetical protein [Acidimicrobiales bacterium]
MTDHWVEWHAAYDRPGSSLARRLEVVQHRIRQVLDGAAPGPFRVVSLCAGEGRDLLGVLDGHPRAADVTGRLVDADPRLVATASARAAAGGIHGLEAITGDAADTTQYDGAVPADLVLVCGVFGNISDDDIARTVNHLPMLCAPGATVIWTRHRAAPDLTPEIRDWFADAGFEEVAFDSAADAKFGVGTHRLRVDPEPYAPGVTLFRFLTPG